MHMSLWYVHMEQNIPNIHTTKISFHLCSVSNDGALPSIWFTADQGSLVTYALKRYSPTGERPAGQQTVEQHSFLLTAAHSIPLTVNPALANDAHQCNNLHVWIHPI